jgi:hypothetical protein
MVQISPNIKLPERLSVRGVPIEYSFYLFDSNQTGIVFYSQFIIIIKILARLGLNIAQNEADIIFNYMDVYRKGYITEIDYDNPVKEIYLSLFQKKLDFKLVIFK